MNTHINPTILRPALSLNRATIISSGIYLPPKIVTSEELMTEIDSEKRYGIPIERMSQVIGIKERREAKEDMQPSDLAVRAAKMALESAKVRNVDKLLFCGMSKDQDEPATSHKINHMLGTNANEVYDVMDACFGFVRGLQDAIRSIQLGEIETALVVTGETTSRLVNDLKRQLIEGVDKKTADKFIGFLTTGDAGGAILLGSSSFYEPSGFGNFTIKSKSEHWTKCYYKRDEQGTYFGQMKMGQIAAHGIRIGNELVERVREKPSFVQPDHMLAHNTGHGTFKALVATGLAEKERWIKSYETLGNLTSATLPVNFHLADSRNTFKSGETIGGLFSGSGLVCGYFDYAY